MNGIDIFDRQIDINKYKKLYQYSISEPEKFWREILTQELQIEYPETSPVITSKNNYHTWYPDLEYNITQRCLDVQLASDANKTAYIHLNEQGRETQISYQELADKVNQVANYFQVIQLKPGDRVVIYMPQTIEQIISMLACARAGLIHVVIYAGFSPDSILERINQTQPKLIITADQTQRNGKPIDLLKFVRRANQQNLETIVLRRVKTKLLKHEFDWSQCLKNQPTAFKPVKRKASDPLFILHTSGTTSQPKGIVHHSHGYMVYAHTTAKAVFKPQAGDIYFCTADCGWITGHSYIVYGTLSNGMTCLLYEGSLKYPTPDRWWQLLEQYQVNQFYTSPTALRYLHAHTPKPRENYNISSLRLIGSVGEPINPSIWEWADDSIGGKQADLVDTWWQTETGGHLLVTLPGIKPLPGVAGLPFYGVVPGIKHNKHTNKGLLEIHQPWPGIMAGVWNNPDRYQKYWSQNRYQSGDYAIEVEPDYYQILGRSDDVITYSGYRIGTAEIENILVSHPDIAEAAVVATADDITTEQIHAFVVESSSSSSELTLSELNRYLKSRYGHHLKIKHLHLRSELPKTRSGKIIRRVLKMEADEST